MPFRLSVILAQAIEGRQPLLKLAPAVVGILGIMKAGGAPAYQNTNAEASTYLIKIAGGVTVTKIAPMAFPRAFSNGVVLPTGQVVIVGGQTVPVPFNDGT